MKRGDVVIVDVDRVGASGGKRRPALVIQNDALNSKETIIASITSSVSNVDQPDQVFIDLSTPDGADTGLSMDSAVRCNRLHTIPQSDVRKVIGRMSAALMKQIDACLKSSLGLS